MPFSPNPKTIADHVRQLASRERREEVAETLRWRAELIEVEDASGEDNRQDSGVRRH
jgi:hypothetical protein